MKNSTYRRLRKHLAYLYLFMTALVMGIIGILIFLLDHYAQVFSNQGTLRDSDFLLFYLKHELEFNLFLLAAGTALLLYLFVLLFFQNLTSEELFEAVWKEKYFDSNNTVMVHIRRLREKMHEPPRNPKFIKTVWGVGYQIEE